MAVNPVTSVPPATAAPAGVKPQAAPNGNAGAAFDNVLAKLVGQTDQNFKVSDQAVHDFATGKTDSLHEVVTSIAKADLSFRLMLEIRNKLVESYQEIMRMQV